MAPSDAPAELVIACATAAAQAGDVASIVVPEAALAATTRPLQALGIAVLADGDAASARDCDGVQVQGAGAVKALRKALGQNVIIGASTGRSSHAAMQAGEDGVDYVALSQSGMAAGEPIVAWWSALFEIPCVAYEPVGPEGLDILLPQNPDFIRPLDDMWKSADEARRVVSALTQALKRT